MKLFIFFLLFYAALSNPCVNYECYPSIVYDNVYECNGPQISIQIDMISGWTFGVCGGITIYKNESFEIPEQRLLAPDMWEECYRMQEKTHYLKVSLIITDRLVTHEFGGDRRLANIWRSGVIAASNLVLSAQLNIMIELVDLHGVVSECDREWEKDCSEGCISRRLQDITNWVRCNKEDLRHIGSIHIVDHIPEGRGAGVAYIGVICTDDFKTGSISFAPGAWRTYVHELLHNLNGVHPLDSNGNVATKEAGLIGYGSGKIDGDYAIDEGNKDRICSEISRKLSCDAFSTTPGGTCGDGIIGIGEECECPGSRKSCKCCKNCILRPGAECFYGECCNIKTCKTRGIETRCGEGYCSSGTCENIHPLLKICSVNGCRFGLVRSDRPPGLCKVGPYLGLHLAKDGTKCDDGVCKKGVCKVGSATRVQVGVPTRVPTAFPTAAPTPHTTAAPTPRPTLPSRERGVVPCIDRKQYEHAHRTCKRHGGVCKCDDVNSWVTYDSSDNEQRVVKEGCTKDDWILQYNRESEKYICVSRRSRVSFGCCSI